MASRAFALAGLLLAAPPSGEPPGAERRPPQGDAAGTAYLQRRFGDRTDLRIAGQWPPAERDRRVLAIADGIDRGLEAIGSSNAAYASLGLTVEVWESGLWERTPACWRACAGLADVRLRRMRAAQLVGCALPADEPVIRVRASSRAAPGEETDEVLARDIAGAILHEAAHKLRYLYLDRYRPPGSADAPRPDLALEREWAAARVPLDSGCPGYFDWIAGTLPGVPRDTARCGLATALGASSSDEDVATMVEYSTFRPDRIPRAGPLPEPEGAYRTKLEILERYRFLP